MKKAQIERINLIAGIVVAISAFIGIFLYFRANNIAQQANQAQLSIISARTTAKVSTAGQYALNTAPPLRQKGACRTNVRLSNNGGANTSLVSAKLLLHVRDKTATYSFSDQPNAQLSATMSVLVIAWDNNAPDLQDEINDFSWDIRTTPLSIDGHAIKDLNFDMLLWVDDDKYLLEIATYMKPDESMDLVTVEYVLNFQGIPEIKVSPFSCFLLTDK
jgi:flagellar basal body-associated protein FliL